MNTSAHRCRTAFSVLVMILFVSAISRAETWESEVLSGVTLQDLASVWTTSSVSPYNTEIFCAGKGGTIIHKNNDTGWTIQYNTGNNLRGIWGSSPSNVFAVGIGRILHYNGMGWSSQYTTANTYNAVWGSSATDVFAVGVNGTILHSDDSGSSWQQQNSNTFYTLNGIWGSSATNVYAVGENFTILHYDGTTWSPIAVNNSPDTALNAIWGYSADSIFVVGDSEVIVWYTGGTWTIISGDLSSTTDLTSVWGASACSVYVSGEVNDITGIIYHFNGSTWSSQADIINPSGPKPLWSIHGTSMRDVFAVGDSGTFATYTLTGDEVYPQICATSPAADATGTAVNATVIALFPTEMDPATITETTFTLTDGTSPISGSVSYESGGFAIFTPDADFDYATTYQATLSTDVKDRFGYGIGSTDYTWSFTSEEEPSSGSSGGGCFISTAFF